MKNGRFFFLEKQENIKFAPKIKIEIDKKWNKP